MTEPTAPVPTPVRTSATNPSDSPAVALGPTSLVFGTIAAAGFWGPWQGLGMLPVTIIAGGLAITFGATGMHYARTGIGRMWTTTLGTVLGVASFANTVWLFVP
ncbi:hypothetical protein [Streptomyces boluensis]|uniref:Uncharacterized protein n=1 Tax=Streptomyces boluensis TaxID=1775135 RepID=A0A964XL75_9ACTN|nr:hypothetical protein [Streptomyces boluensis]NBE51801.1 hypothetical protein [Streptomyces boluensis]